MEKENDQIQVVQVDTSLSLITKAEIDVQISTAKAFPRSIKMFMDKAISMATVSEDVADSCNYALPRGGKSIEGPSVRLAEIVCSAYGNVRAGSRVIANDGKTITAQGICHDLETNVCVTIEVYRSITDKHGKTYSEDMQTVTRNAACSIAFRNAVFKTVPSAYVAPIMEKAKEVARGTVETLPKRRDKAIAYLKSLKVTEKQICDVLEIKKIEDIDLDKLDILRGMATLIRNGESTVKELFEPVVDGVDLEELEKLFDLKKDALSMTEMVNAERIIDSKETSSYRKLLTLLKSK